MKMKFGIIKSKIEKVLLESYSNNTFKSEIKHFNSLVVGNKNLSRLYYLYDELNSNKGLNESIANDYINESIKIYENTVNKIKDSDIKKINEWVSSIKTDNLYENIDNIFNLNVLNIESNIQSKKVVVESLKKTPLKKQEVLNIPINSMIKVANNTITNYINGLNESDKKELVNLLSEDDKTLNENFEPLKSSVISKLTSLKDGNSDYETGKRITETISKIESEKYDKLNYFKLKGLNDNL